MGSETKLSQFQRDFLPTFILDLSVSSIDSLMGWKSFIRTNCLKPLKTLRPMVRIRLNIIKPPSNILLTVPRLYLYCGSSVLQLHVMSICIWSSAILSVE